MDGTSLRVKAQDVNRRAIEKKHPRSWVEETIWNMLLGIRNAPSGGTRVVVKYLLPNGTFWEGTDESDLQQTVAATLVDMGLDADKALAAASQVKLNK